MKARAEAALAAIERQFQYADVDYVAGEGTALSKGTRRVRVRMDDRNKEIALNIIAGVIEHHLARWLDVARDGTQDDEDYHAARLAALCDAVERMVHDA